MGGAGESVTLAELGEDPYPAYRRLRDEEPVAWVPAANRYLVTRWDDVAHVDQHDELFTAAERPTLMTRAMGLTMLRTDGAAHARLRGAAEEPMRPRVVRERWVPVLHRVANELLDGLADRGEAELMGDFCGPFAARTLQAVLGLDGPTDDDVQRWSQAFIDGVGNYADDPSVWARCEEACRGVDAALDAAIPRVAERPDGTVLSAMVQGGLDLDDVRANVKLFLSGGLNEPRDAIALAVMGLFSDPAQAAAVRADPSRFAAAADEALRWTSPIGMYPRQVVRDTALAGVELREGDRVGVVIASANRDERRWADPDRFDLARGRPKHVAFSAGGPHFCLGAWVARHQVGTTALPLLFGRLPNLRPDPDHPPEVRGWVFRGPRHLRVRWDA